MFFKVGFVNGVGGAFGVWVVDCFNGEVTDCGYIGLVWSSFMF